MMPSATCAISSAERYGREFLPDSANFYKSKKGAQDAHEAIRPTSMAYAPEVVDKYLQEDEMKAVPADLEPLRGQPDDAGALRPDHHRRRAPRARTATITCSAPPVRC